MTLRNLNWLALTLWVGAASAQLVPVDPDWKESEAPTPPAFSAKQLIPLTMPSYVSLKFGIDPSTLVITPDGILRYVVVASNASGSTTAMYEGIRCSTGEVKTYARFNSSGEWDPINEPKWMDLAGRHPSKHALVIARQGACEGATITGYSVADIVRALKR